MLKYGIEAKSGLWKRKTLEYRRNYD